MHLLQTALLILFPILVITGGLRDLVSYIIPNWVSAALIVAFVPAALALGLPLNVLGVNLAVAGVALVAAVIMWTLGWIGGGDAKLFAATALWIGWPSAVDYLLVTGTAGGALAMALLGLRSLWVRPYVQSGPAWFRRLATPGENVPYGVAIAIGAMAAFPGSALVHALQSQT